MTDSVSTMIFDKIVRDIKHPGYSMIGVFGTDTSPPFTYTVGLNPKHGAELIMIGLRMEYAGQIINDLMLSPERKDKIDLRLLPRHTGIEGIANMPLALVDCNHNLEKLHEDHVTAADAFYGKTVDVIQIVMCDRDGRFPWDQGYDHEYMDPRQPIFSDYRP